MIASAHETPPAFSGRSPRWTKPDLRDSASSEWQKPVPMEAAGCDLTFPDPCSLRFPYFEMDQWLVQFRFCLDTVVHAHLTHDYPCAPVFEKLSNVLSPDAEAGLNSIDTAAPVLYLSRKHVTCSFSGSSYPIGDGGLVDKCRWALRNLTQDFRMFHCSQIPHGYPLLANATGEIYPGRTIPLEWYSCQKCDLDKGKASCRSLPKASFPPSRTLRAFNRAW